MAKLREFFNLSEGFADDFRPAPVSGKFGSVNNITRKRCKIFGCHEREDDLDTGLCDRHSDNFDLKNYGRSGQDCMVPGCKDQPYEGGICMNHYSQYGSPDVDD